MAEKKKDSSEDLDFEIQFIEGVLRFKPDFLQALMALGHLYTRRGLYQKGLEVDLKLARLRPYDPYVFYNLACSYSLLNRIDEAFGAIRSAVDYGYWDFEYLQEDSDLSNFRRDSRYQDFFVNLMNKKVSRSP